MYFRPLSCKTGPSLSLNRGRQSTTVANRAQLRCLQPTFSPPVPQIVAVQKRHRAQAKINDNHDATFDTRHRALTLQNFGEGYLLPQRRLGGGSLFFRRPSPLAKVYLSPPCKLAMFSHGNEDQIIKLSKSNILAGKAFSLQQFWKFPQPTF